MIGNLHVQLGAAAADARVETFEFRVDPLSCGGWGCTVGEQTEFARARYADISIEWKETPIMFGLNEQTCGTQTQIQTRIECITGLSLGGFCRVSQILYCCLDVQCPALADAQEFH